MTGFGCGEAALGDGQVRVELRSVNHRALDVRVRVPDELSAHAFALEKIARSQLSRGRFDITVRYEHGDAATGLDVTRARALFRALAELRDELAPGTELGVGTLALVPELMASGSPGGDEAAGAALERALQASLSDLATMREREGEALCGDLAARIAEGRAVRTRIEQYAAASVVQRGERLRARVTEIVAAHQLEPDAVRLETELAIIAERADIAEELTRLDSHFEQLDGVLSSGEPVGRKLDFLLQEVGREVNTIGSKSHDVRIAHAVVELKNALDRMRQQAANVE